MSELVIPSPVDCVWTGDWNERDHPNEGGEWWEWELPVGSVGYWRDKFGTGPMRPGLDRRPIFVMCPGWMQDGRLRGSAFCVDSPATSGAGYWDVAVDMDSLVIGQKPNITVQPSIHLVGIWHGWLQQGTLRQA